MRTGKQTFFYHASILALSNLGLQLFGFLYRIALSRLAGAEGLGVYRLVLSVYNVIYSACLSGVTLACARMGAAKMAQQRPEQLRCILRIAVGVFSILFVACAALILPFHDFIAHTLLGDDRTAAALPIMLVCLFLTGIENVIKSLFTGIGKVQYTAISETTEQILRMTAVVFLLVIARTSDYGRIAALILLGMTISECFSVSFLSFLYCRHIRPLGKQTAESGLMRSMLEIALPLSLAAIFGNLISSVNAVILPQRLMAGGMSNREALSALGVISSMAGPLILLPIALISALSSILVPHITTAQAQNNALRIHSLTRKALFMTGLIGLPATAVLIPLSPTLSRLFFAQTVSLSYMLLLGIDAVLTYYQITTASILNGIGAQRQAVCAAILGEAVQLILTWKLSAIPALGIYGYIYSMICSAFLVITCNFYMIHHKMHVTWNPVRAFGIPLLCGATVFFWVRIFYTVFLGCFGTQWCAALWSIVSALFLYIVLLYLLGFRVFSYLRVQLQSPTISLLWSYL